jgi:hypothetical protein
MIHSPYVKKDLILPNVMGSIAINDDTNAENRENKEEDPYKPKMLLYNFFIFWSQNL